MQSGHRFSIILFACKLAIVALFLNLKFKRLFNPEQGNKA